MSEGVAGCDGSVEEGGGVGVCAQPAEGRPPAIVIAAAKTNTARAGRDGLLSLVFPVSLEESLWDKDDVVRLQPGIGILIRRPHHLINIDSNPFLLF